MIGRNIGPFQIVESLGEGALGTVYHAVDQAGHRDAAIEILRPEYNQNAELNGRLQSEVAALSRLAHPAIAACYGFFRDGNDGFLMKEYVPGETLDSRMQRTGALPWQQASDLVLQSLDGLKQAHDVGIVHGDVKPANIMITPEGRVKLKDFGIARALNQVGPEYLAPECVMGKPADGRSDLYSLGLVFYQMLTGRMAFQGATPAEILKAHVEQAAKLPSELGIQVPQAIEQALMRALAKNPEYRIADAAAFAAQLRGAVESSGGGKAPAAAPPAPMPVPPPSAPGAMATATAAFATPPPPASPPPPGPTPPAAPPMGSGRPPAPPAAFVPPAPPPAAAAPKKPAAQKSGSKKGLWIALASAVVLIGGAVGGYFALKDRWKPQPPKQVAQSEPAPPAAATPAPAPAPSVDTPPPASEPAPNKPTPLPSSTAPTTPAAAGAGGGGVNRAAVLAALEQTDGPVPAGAVPGARPLQYAGILKATAIPGSAPIVLEAVQKRGVNFRLNTKQIFALRKVGAQDPLIQTLPGAYREESNVAAAAPASAPPPPDPGAPPAPPPSNTPSPAPASAPAPTAAPAGPPLQHLREVHRLFVQSKDPTLDQDLKQAIQTELASQVTIAPSAASADAILRIEVVEDQAGKVGRAFGAKNKHKATAQVVEKRQGHVLWSDEVEERQDVSAEGGRKIASKIAKQLRKDWGK